jgi:hypothetical protein
MLYNDLAPDPAMGCVTMLSQCVVREQPLRESDNEDL